MFSNPAESFATERFIAEPGEYAVQIVSFKCREFKRDDELESYILAFTLRMNEGPDAGTLLASYDCWLGTEEEPRKEGINNMMKPILAACGITPGEKGSDDQFRAQFSHLDLGFDPTTNTFNSGWDSIKGADIRVALTKKAGKDGNMYQNFNRFMPA
jgi:hypothetical protein